MNLRKPLSLSDFTIEIAAPIKRVNVMCVNIYEDGKFNMNGKLAQKLGGKSIRIAFLENAKSLALLETSNNISAIKFPKSGSCKLPMVVSLLKKHKIPLPAKYEVWYNECDNFWQGDYVENPTSRHLGKCQNMK